MHWGIGAVRRMVHAHAPPVKPTRPIIQPGVVQAIWRRGTITAAVLIGLLLVVYPNALALLSARRAWDQWQAFTLGNTVLALGLFAYAAASGLLPEVWGHPDLRGVLLGLTAGIVPLAIILAAMFSPGPLGRDIVSSGIDDISRSQFVYRLSIQVALTTVLVEEFAFRGLLQSLLVRAVAAPWAVGIDAVAYGLWHAALQANSLGGRRGSIRWLAPLAGTGIYGLLGVLLAAVRMVGDSLASPIAAHGVLDVVMFLAMLVRREQSARDRPRVTQ